MTVADAVVEWPDDVDDVIRGDLTVAVAYLTPAGGAVVTGVAPFGLADRRRGTVGFHTSLGFGKKLERIVREPAIALAYHTREHGFSARPLFVLGQGSARVDLQPSRDRLDAFLPDVERFIGELKHGPVWDRLLREYYTERVFVDVDLQRLTAWPDLDGAGPPRTWGTPPAPPPAPQLPPKNGTGPRVDLEAVARRIGGLGHRVIAYRGADGLPVVLPVELGGHDHRGLRLVAPAGLLPPGGRRAGLLAHSFRPQLVGLSTRVFTGWLDVGPDGAVYAPHTSRGFMVPPQKDLLLVANGLMAKMGLRRARREGTLDRLRAAQQERTRR